MTLDELRASIEAMPDPLDGPPIYQRGSEGMDAYDMAARSAAKAMLIVATEDPSLLIVPSKEDDPTGFARALSDAHWKAACARWPGLDDWLGGITGFQFGWANGVVRYILGAEPVGNPAIITISDR